MESVYKVCILGKDKKVKEVIVFSPNEDETPFDNKERAFIESEQVPVRLSKTVIHPDDSIFTVKHKLLDFLSKEGGVQGLPRTLFL